MVGLSLGVLNEDSGASISRVATDLNGPVSTYFMQEMFETDLPRHLGNTPNVAMLDILVSILPFGRVCMLISDGVVASEDLGR